MATSSLYFVIYLAIATSLMGTLKYRSGGLYTELLFVFIVFFSIYTVAPMIMYWTDTYPPFSPLGFLGLDERDVSNQLRRHCFFLFSLGLGYLLVRGNKRIPIVNWAHTRDKLEEASPKFIFVICVGIIISLALLLLLSAPVESYSDHYTRYDHLNIGLQKSISVFLRISQGLYCLILIMLFRSYEKYGMLCYVFAASICAFELIYSMGARISVLYIIVLCFFLQVRYVSVPRLFKIVVAGIFFIMMFTAVELLRLNNSADVAELIAKATSLAGEFEAVFYSAIHLFRVREFGYLPPVSGFTIIYDFIALIPFMDNFEFHPMSWYWVNFNYDGNVPNMTMGPIANSALIGGEVGLLLRGVLAGIFYGFVARYYAQLPGVTGTVFYAYLYSTVIMMPKWTIFVQWQGLIKTIIPVLLVYFVIKKLFPSRHNLVKKNVEIPLK